MIPILSRGGVTQRVGALIVDHMVQANVADSTYGQYQSGRPAVGNNQIESTNRWN